ncbi:restriction endonuclease [Paenibacillus sp. YPG26]|uniref:restriction endonuclease n=1 Tax=Paenibacillus sp. YPG26 TaxID=2878915 RepID=UPI00203C94A5|nr:restriction endonuclease [Paenibacillus sp. YPG26]USB34270.1 restriction endonuclease [Paenibacillus sp. YPG26]
MDGVDFEKYLGHLFRSQGYKAEVTQASGDYGADLVLSKDGKRVVVQAKRYSKNVGLKAVQEVHGAIAHYRATAGWVVTNRDYTDQAYKLAKSNGVRLIGRDELVEMLLQMRERQP